MGAEKSKVLIELTKDKIDELTKQTHFEEKEIKMMYKRYWAYCSEDGTLNKQQFTGMFNNVDGKGNFIVDHIFRTSDIDDNLSLGK